MSSNHNVLCPKTDPCAKNAQLPTTSMILMNRNHRAFTHTKFMGGRRVYKFVTFAKTGMFYTAFVCLCFSRTTGKVVDEI